MFDWWWWITYSCKYNHAVHRIFYNRRNASLTLRNRVFNFYDSPDFHQYSFAAHEEKMMDLRVWASNKHTLKEFILDYCKRTRLAGENTAEMRLSEDSLDDHTVYYYNKIKVPSVAPSFRRGGLVHLAC
jgi:hypothetical protein